MENNLLSRAEVAKRLNVSPEMVSKLIRAGN